MTETSSWKSTSSWEAPERNDCATGNLSAALNASIDEAPLSRFHTRSVFTAGMGSFTDAYGLFVIGVATTLIAPQWHLSSSLDGKHKANSVATMSCGYPIRSGATMSCGSRRNDVLRSLSYVAGLALLSAHVPDGDTWRILLNLGAMSAASVLYMGWRMPESAHYTDAVLKDTDKAARHIEGCSDNVVRVPELPRWARRAPQPARDAEGR